jgi:carbon-monoxide dehydrogenase small subunit
LGVCSGPQHRGGDHGEQEAFQEKEGFQCGYCTPGMLMSASALLRDVPDPTREDVEAYLSENICRCTGYEPIVESVYVAAARTE